MSKIIYSFVCVISIILFWSDLSFVQASPVEQNTENSNTNSQTTGVSQLFESIDGKFAAAKKYLDGLFSQQNLQEQTVAGLSKVDSAISNIESTKTDVVNAGIVADSTIKSDQEASKETQSAKELTKKIEQDGLSFKEDALEAKRWLDKIVEKSLTAESESKLTKEKVEKSQQLIDMALARDTAIREKMKEIYEKSTKTIQEASETKTLLNDLQKKQQEANEEIQKGKTMLNEMKEEEDKLKRHEEELKNKIQEEEELHKHQNEELELTKKSFQLKIDELSKNLNEALKEKEQTVIDLQKTNSELKLVKEEELLKDKEMKETEESFQKQSEEQSKIINEALDAVREAKESADLANKREKEAEDKAKTLEKEMEAVREKMHNKLELARSRTKEWLHKQTLEMTEKSLEKDSEIKRLQFEIERIQKEEKEEKEKVKLHEKEIQERIEKQIKEMKLKEKEEEMKLKKEEEMKLKQQQLQLQEQIKQMKQKQEQQLQLQMKQQLEEQQRLQQKLQQQQQLQQLQQLQQQQQQQFVQTQANVVQQQQQQFVNPQEQKQLQNEFQFWQKQQFLNKNLYDVDALQVEEQSGAEYQMPTKEQVYEKLIAVHQKLEKLLGMSQTGESPSIPVVDFERTSNSDYKLARRQTKKAIESINSLPSGYPPPPSTSKLQEAGMINLELGEGLTQISNPDNSITAQGVNDPSDVLDMSNAHKKNCLKICSGGDRTVYRDGVVSTVPEEASNAHETGACMKMCAMFVIEAQEKCADPSKC